ncbi:MAG: DUF4290 domain-containing protein [Muribaculaceae bacterium]|nr:DUF4290 domain-containing protein [Muribaculaceae bacterium]
MIPYNVSEPKLALPEYGRNIQRMIDHCVAIENREERTRCAHSIAKVMATLIPVSGEADNNQRKIWDHINIMSGFKLDIDFPCEVIGAEGITLTKNKIPYNSQFTRYRHYGKNIQSMITTVSEMENCIEKDQLIFLLANQMKKLLVLNNPENASDCKVFSDIADISQGKIQIDAEKYKLNEYISSAPSNSKNKKKKK